MMVMEHRIDDLRAQAEEFDAVAGQLQNRVQEIDDEEAAEIFRELADLAQRQSQLGSNLADSMEESLEEVREAREQNKRRDEAASALAGMVVEFTAKHQNRFSEEMGREAETLESGAERLLQIIPEENYADTIED